MLHTTGTLITRPYLNERKISTLYRSSQTLSPEGFQQSTFYLLAFSQVIFRLSDRPERRDAEHDKQKKLKTRDKVIQNVEEKVRENDYLR